MRGTIKISAKVCADFVNSYSLPNLLKKARQEEVVGTIAEVTDNQRLIMAGIGKLKNIGLIPDRQHSFAGRRTYFNGAVEDDGIAWVSLTADSFSDDGFCAMP